MRSVCPCGGRSCALKITSCEGLLIREFGHYYCGDHLSAHDYDALCPIGANLSVLKLQRPDLFERFSA